MIGNKGSTLSLRELLSGKDADFDKAMTDGKVQLMRLKNIAITIDGQVHKDKNLFDLFLDHQNDGLFEDYVREHTPVNANLLIQADYVIALWQMASIPVLRVCIRFLEKTSVSKCCQKIQKRNTKKKFF